MHDVTLVYTEYNHRLEVWVLGKRAANTTADRQQYTNTSKVCDDTMSMLRTELALMLHVTTLALLGQETSHKKHITTPENMFKYVKSGLMPSRYR